jgi:hypothetical protein
MSTEVLGSAFKRKNSFLYALWGASKYLECGMADLECDKELFVADSILLSPFQ